MAKKAKKPLTKKEKYRPIPGSAVAGAIEQEMPKQGDTAYINLQPKQEIESDNEEMSEAEVEAMEQRQEKRKQDLKTQLEKTVDSQEWTLSDPAIPGDLAGKVWIAVFRCPDGHKTKATNRQSDSGVWCWKHREAGQKVMATIMPQFLTRPQAEDPDVAKRKKAAKGAQ